MRPDGYGQCADAAARRPGGADEIGRAGRMGLRAVRRLVPYQERQAERQGDAFRAKGAVAARQQGAEQQQEQGHAGDGDGQADDAPVAQRGPTGQGGGADVDQGAAEQQGAAQAVVVQQQPTAAPGPAQALLGL
ncbi:hypothetical protein P797_25135 [Pseudomonas aeruginosa VRFPA04]|nr:hypothetical protein P797_25135 [Pseudomonas aeruginosa VRFPA04]